MDAISPTVLGDPVEPSSDSWIIGQLEAQLLTSVSQTNTIVSSVEDSQKFIGCLSMSDGRGKYYYD